ncbi:hypothetical protein B0G62_10441 [Paraburkholderia eburnea]|uniref:Uncharacterized protein n=1 Tax=Paraburkholderia eburnea TaxID=1189126 RepID=A0A2S4MDF1_9BURK|nr:hypothetical protein [Paraburkholderia eburnea]POR52744.1 hypothetical protein B0G62_10441 [Paraburkholderia eburnea]PRZ23612.1 hypothetical protein BX588_10441 [Paraburkholderia eburnea]
MARYAVVIANVVENVIEWDGTTPYSPGENATLVQSDTLNIGDGHEAQNSAPAGNTQS